MKMKKFIALGMAGMLSAATLVGCDKGGATTPTPTPDDNGGSTATSTTTPDDGGDVVVEEEKEYSEDEIVNWTMFIAMPGSEINDGNDIQEIIAKGGYF